MQERLKQLWTRVVELWNKLTKRQRVMTISSVAVVVVTLVILIILLNQVQYERLTTFDSTAMAKTAMETLTASGIPNRLEEDNVTISVDVTRKQDAVLALTSNDSSGEMTLQMLLESDISQTGYDKSLRAHLFMQSEVANRLTVLQGVDKASIVYFPANNSNSILQQPREISCSVFLTINDQFNPKVEAKSIATTVAYAIGNETTDKIKVIDQYGNLLFGGDEEDEQMLDLNANLAYKKTVEKWYNDKLFELAIKNDFYDAEIVASLDVNCDRTSVLYTEYLAAEGQEQGLYDTYTKIASESTGVAGDIPGTDSNDEPDYYIQTSNAGNSSYDELTIKYKPSERVTETMKEWGVINRANSSLAIVLTRITEFKEEDLEVMGLLEGTTFQEYTLNHLERTRLEVPQEYYELFSDATGIPASNITILAYEQPNFTARPESETNVSFYLEILLAVLIIGLLLFVVFRAMRPEEVIETEPELSVERLLATTRDNQSPEDIEFGEKSETYRLIEKYIDENAESVAALLRNWLSDDGWD